MLTIFALRDVTFDVTRRAARTRQRLIIGLPRFLFSFSRPAFDGQINRPYVYSVGADD